MTSANTDDVTADKISRMNSEVFQAILSAHIQSNASASLDGALHFRWPMKQYIMGNQLMSWGFFRKKIEILYKGLINHLT